MREEQDPILLSANERGKEYEHPAFAQISISRISGGQVSLYDSNFRHNHTIRLSINKSFLERKLSHDFHYTKMEPHIEIEMSEAQFATFITSMNVGSGVPCTVRRLHGQSVPGIPLRQEAQETLSEFKEKTEKVINILKETLKNISSELGEKLPKKTREAILSQLNMAIREVSQSMPWVVETFEKHMEATVEKAKMEIHAYVQSTTLREGITIGEVPLRLGNGEENV